MEMTDKQVAAIALQAAMAAGKNANVTPQLLYGDIYLVLRDELIHRKDKEMEQEPVKYGAFKEITDDLAKEEIVAALDKGGTFPRTIYKSRAVGISTVEPKNTPPAIAVPLLPAELNAITLALIFYRKQMSDRIDGGIKDDVINAIDHALMAVSDATGSRKCLGRDIPPQPPCTNDHVAEGCEPFAAAESTAIPEARMLSYALEGVVRDVEDGNGFDDACLMTIQRVSDALGGMARNPPPPAEKPCPACHDQDEVVCSFCETCNGAGWVPK